MLLQVPNLLELNGNVRDAQTYETRTPIPQLPPNRTLDYLVYQSSRSSPRPSRWATLPSKIWHEIFYYTFLDLPDLPRKLKSKRYQIINRQRSRYFIPRGLEHLPLSYDAARLEMFVSIGARLVPILVFIFEMTKFSARNVLSLQKVIKPYLTLCKSFLSHSRSPSATYR